MILNSLMWIQLKMEVSGLTDLISKEQLDHLMHQVISDTRGHTELKKKILTISNRSEMSNGTIFEKRDLIKIIYRDGSYVPYDSSEHMSRILHIHDLEFDIRFYFMTMVSIPNDHLSPETISIFNLISESNPPLHLFSNFCTFIFKHYSS